MIYLIDFGYSHRLKDREAKEVPSNLVFTSLKTMSDIHTSARH